MAGKKKPRSPHYKANNDGGFGNPPVRSQFTAKSYPGPGRPPGATSLRTAMGKMLRSKVGIKVNGVETEVPMAEALAQRVRKEMLTGPSNNLELSIKLMEDYGPVDATEDRDLTSWTDFSTEEKFIMRSMMARAMARGEYVPLHYASKDLIGTYEIYRRDDGWLGFRRIVSGAHPGAAVIEPEE